MVIDIIGEIRVKRGPVLSCSTDPNGHFAVIQVVELLQALDRRSKIRHIRWPCEELEASDDQHTTHLSLVKHLAQNDIRNPDRRGINRGGIDWNGIGHRIDHCNSSSLHNDANSKADVEVESNHRNKVRLRTREYTVPD